MAALSHPNGWRRDTAQQLLVERRDTTVVPDLTRLAASAPDWRTRLHALWALDGMDVVQPATISSALDDASGDVRACGGANLGAVAWGSADIRSERRCSKRSATRTGRYGDSSPRRSAPCPLVRERRRWRRCSRREERIPVLLDAALSGIRGLESAVLERVAGSDPKRQGATRRSSC